VFLGGFCFWGWVGVVVVGVCFVVVGGVGVLCGGCVGGGWVFCGVGSFVCGGFCFGFVGFGSLGSLLSVLAVCMGLLVFYYDAVT
ncbi:hypothetical protein DVA80_21020, partial [Acinetobacter baumannii]